MWESVELQRLQNLYDREFAPCWFCRRCGNEIYGAEAYEEHEGLCLDCWEEDFDDEPV